MAPHPSSKKAAPKRRGATTDAKAKAKRADASKTPLVDDDGARAFEGATFDQLRAPAGTVLRKLRFVDCTFNYCRTSSLFPDRPLEGSAYVTLEEIAFIRSKAKMTTEFLVILRDVLIEDWRGLTEPVVLVNFLFDRVKLCGHIRSVMCQSQPDRLSNRELDVALDFYEGVDWAIDLREASFETFDLRGVPGEKVLRDPERHCLLYKNRLLADPSWRDFKPGLVNELELILKEPGSSRVLVAPDRSKYFEQFKRDHELLREKGYAE